MGVRQAPLSFSNSFWTSDYTTGYNTVYEKLDQGLVEDDEIIQFIKVGSCGCVTVLTLLGTSTR